MIEIQVNQSDVQKTTALQNGTFKITVNALKQGDTVKADQTAPTAVSMGTTTVPQSTEGTTSSLYTLGLAGINATGTSTSGPKQQYFAEFDLIAPLHWLGKGCWSPAKDSAGNFLAPVNGKSVRDDEIYPLEGRCWVWLNPRIASAPAAGSTALTSLTSASSLTQGIGTQTNLVKPKLQRAVPARSGYRVGRVGFKNYRLVDFRRRNRYSFQLHFNRE